jgi:predicted DsbA family dithiol-disulfide isomerase
VSTLRIDAFFDFICPWCLIGKRQLDHALLQLRDSQPEVAVQLHWHGVQLLPQLPVAGVPFAEFYLDRLGSEQAVRQRQAQVQQAAAAAGVRIDLSDILRMPNTADAHRLLERASQLGSAEQCDALLERLFCAYFQRGGDLGDRATLLNIAADCGFAPGEVQDSLRGDGRAFIGAAGSLGTSGVPYFVFNRQVAVSGAQSAEVLLSSMRKALAADQSARQPA